MRIVVIGAGVSGLTSAVVLREAGHDVTIVAREIEETTSHAAAAIWLPYHIGSEHVDRWSLETRDAFIGLLNEPDAGISMIDFDVLYGEPPACIASECVPLERGFRARVPLIDTTRYLPYLLRRFGSAIETREIRDLRELDAGVIVNCTGFGARELVNDESLLPGYGIAVVTDRPPMERALVTDEPLMYVIPRTDDCILGGYDAVEPPAESEAEAIVARCRKAVPQLSGVVRAVKRGVRPVRATVRVERDGNVVHNYGHGGAGFTVSWGCAREVERLV